MHDYFSEERSYWILFCLELLIFLVELFGGWYSGSLTLLTDAAGVVGDVLPIVLAIIIVRRLKAKKRSSGKIEVVAGYIGSILIAGMAIWIFFEAKERMEHPEHISAGIMVFVAFLGGFLGLVQHLLIRRKAGGEFGLIRETLDVRVLGDFWERAAMIGTVLVIYLTGKMMFDVFFSCLLALWLFLRAVKLFRKSWRHDSILASST